MPPHEPPKDEFILESLPDDIHAAISTYVHESELTANVVMKGR